MVTVLCSAGRYGGSCLDPDNPCEVHRLNKENERLRAALRPFADEFENWSPAMPDDVQAFVVSEHDEDLGMWLGSLRDCPTVTVGQLRQAHALVYGAPAHSGESQERT